MRWSTLPLDRAARRSPRRDRQKNESGVPGGRASRSTRRRRADAVLAVAAARSSRAVERCCRRRRTTLDSLRQFIDRSPHHHDSAVRSGAVKETPPFMRSTTSASMDTPGPFETAKLDGFYNMTLPDPRWSPKAEQDDYMRAVVLRGDRRTSPCTRSIRATTSSSSTRSSFRPTCARCSARARTPKGWAHYCEQMMLDEGFHAGDPKYRLAQLQDALLRDVRFIVGIKMHTQGMTVDEATKLFETAGPSAASGRRVRKPSAAPAIALYGYYTMGKLMILKLRDDYKAKQSAPPTRCRASTTPSSSSARCRCRSSAARCWRDRRPLWRA